tara:strand:+ start:41802 stop:42710 length:909 start_codon:yes stop_codon:yes gene_type:complete
MKKNSNLKFTEFFLSKYKNFDFHFHLLLAGARFGYDEIFEIFGDKLKVTGFDPDVNECKRLNKIYQNKKKFLPYCLFEDKIEKEFYEYNHKSSSSLYKINENFVKKFHSKMNFETETIHKVQTETLDNIFDSEKISKVDFMQIDCEGAELNILKGASKLLENTICIETEILFQKDIRLSAPNYSTLDNYLINKNYSLYDIELFRFSKVPSAERIADYKDDDGNNIPGPTLKGQVLAGDAVYFKNLGMNDNYSDFSFEELIKYLFLLEIYFMQDTAYDLVLNSKEIIEKNTDRTYLEFLNFFY